MEENCAFVESCLNLALNKSSHFISAYPTKIVFGKCSPTGYITSKFFQFELFELYRLYCAIFDIVKLLISIISGKNLFGSATFSFGFLF